MGDEGILAVQTSRQITLFRSDPGATQYRHVLAEISAAGTLSVSAQDMGPLVEALWGGSDYEFGLRLDAESAMRLLRELEPSGEPAGGAEPVLAALAARFAGRRNAVGELRGILDDASIAYEWWTWS